MKLSLSTNWCNRRLESGEEIADKAIELGFDELELGFHTSQFQVSGFKARLDRMPVGSIHAFCPVPVSAPCGYPELYQLASFDASMAQNARYHVTRNVEFAAEMGADTVVLHAGRVVFSTLFARRTSGSLRLILRECGDDAGAKKYAKALAKARKVREERGARLLDLFRLELERLFPVLTANRVTLALENLPYLEGYPNEAEMNRLLDDFAGAPLKAWFDTGHHRVRHMHGWTAPELPFAPERVAGMHLNDVVDFNDDHLAPGDGKVDFAALAPLARKVGHVVFEPSQQVSEEALAKSVGRIRGIFA